MQLANPNSSTDASLNALLLAGAAPIATNSGLTVEARAAFPQFDSFLLDAPPEVASTTTDGLPIFPEQIAERVASADHGAVSISCAVALGRWLVETEVPAQTVEEGEEGVDSTVTGSTGETEASKKKEKSVSESPTRLTKAESEKAKNAESAAGALPAESLLIAGYFTTTDLPAVELSSDETMEGDAGEFSDGLVSDEHDAVGEGESIQPRDLPQGTRIDGESDEMGRSLGELREPHARESVRRESKEVDSPKKPTGDFSTRVVAESVALKTGRDSTERAAPSDLTGQRAIEDASARRQPLPAFGNPLSRLPVPNNTEVGAKLVVSGPGASALGATEDSVVMPARVAPADLVSANEGEANTAAVLSNSDAGASRIRTRAEFAVSSARRDPEQDDDETEGMKHFVSSDKEILTRQRQSLGIAIAKPALSMSSRFSSLLPDAAASDRPASASAVTAGFGEMAEVSSAEHLELVPVSAAHEAVEVVLHATEQLAARDQKSVRLQFSVGDAHLDVRVELRANEVRTQFRTDSSELRQALSHEWQAAAVELGQTDRGFRIAPAIFSSSTNDQSAFNAFAGDTSSRQREHRASHEANGRSPRALAAVAGGRATADAVSTSARSSRSAPPTSQHLHTLA